MHLLIFFLDGLRYDYLNRENAPFLTQVGEAGVLCPLRTVLGYSAAIKPSIWTGVNPSAHGWYEHWGLTRGRSTKPASLYGYFKCLPNRTLRTLARQAIRYILISLKSGIGDLYLPAIPDEVFSHLTRTSFDYEELDSIGTYRTLFGTLTDAKVPWRYHRNVKFDYEPKQYFGVEQSKSKSVNIFFSGRLDWLGHKYGPSSHRISHELRELDRFVRKTSEFVASRTRHPACIMVFSDHGMVAKVGYVDVQRAVEQLSPTYTQPRDFIAFYGSTIVRFWIFNQKAKDLIVRALQKVKNGRVLSEDELEAYGLAFKDSRYGEILFLVESGYIIYPNYYVGILPRWIRTDKGWHGYCPDDPTQQGIFLCYVPGRKLPRRNRVHVTDILPTILDILELPIPEECVGESVLR